MDRSQRLLSETCEYLPAAKRLIRCGRTIRSKDGVKVKRGCDGNVFTSGLSTCGSVWSCPSCSFKIRVKRALEIALAIVVHLARGGGVLFMTFTMSHERGEELADVWDILTDGWSYMTSGEQWQAIKERFGIVGWIKSTEVTHGRNGWHPHLHVLVFTERPLSPLDSSTTTGICGSRCGSGGFTGSRPSGVGTCRTSSGSTRSRSSPTSPAASAST